MAFKFILLASVACSVSLAVPQQLGDRSFPRLDLDVTLNERAETTTPVPILRFVDRQNADGSYTYGFENGDGTYKIETRYATGEVKGKYGYFDPSGELREVEYGATPDRGFEPKADGLVVAPPTLVDETVEDEPEAPAAPVRPVSAPGSARKFANFAPRDNNNRRVVIRKRPALNTRARARPAPRPAPRPAAPRAPVAPALPVTPTAPAFVPPQPVQALPVNSHRFLGHPARNIDLNTGSFTVEISG